MSAKSAAKLAARYAKMKPLPVQSREPDASGEPAGTHTPEILRQGQAGAGMWDVYFNGSLQHLCCFADRTTGAITRYTAGRGNRPTTQQTENLRGLVQFVRKGQPAPLNNAPTVRPAVAQVAEPDRSSNGPSVNEGAIPSGAACTEAAEFTRKNLEELKTVPRHARVAVLGSRSILGLAAMIAAGVKFDGEG